MVEETDIDSLPDELLLDILARLSDYPNHLYHKGRLVCRRWCHLIRSHHFIQTQLHRSTHGLVICCGDGFADFVTATQGGIKKSEISYKLVPPGFQSMSSCNGLVLHVQRHRVQHAMRVTNPVTRQQLLLPPLSGKKLMSRFVRHGIGYAAGSMEYKVAASYMEADTGLQFLCILSVGRDKSWRSVGVEHLPTDARRLLSDNTPLLFEFPLVTNGSLIMWSDIHSGRYLTLDVETEILTFHPRPGPEAAYPAKTKWVYLSTERSVLSLLVVPNNSYLMQLWEMAAETGEWRMVMDDIKLGAQEQWLRQFHVACCGPVMPMVPLGWLRYPEILALIPFPARTSRIIFFNLHTQEVSSMELPLDGYFFTRAHNYKKSLTWLRP